MNVLKKKVLDTLLLMSVSQPVNENYERPAHKLLNPALTNPLDMLAENPALYKIHVSQVLIVKIYQKSHSNTTVEATTIVRLVVTNETIPADSVTIIIGIIDRDAE